MRCSAVAFVALLVVLHARVRAADAPAPLPTAAELHKLAADKDYPELLQKLSRVLQLRGDAARPYDRVELYLLKADTHLQLKEQSLATAALESAVREIDERTPPREAAIARTTELMMKRSRAWTYSPRSTPFGQAVKPIDVIEPANRTQVFTAMFDDEKAEIGAKVRAASTSQTLGPVIEGVKAVGELRTVELAAFGKQNQSAEMLDGLAGNAHDLMARALKGFKNEAGRLDAQANELLPIVMDQFVQNTTGFSTVTYCRKRGLFPKDRDELKGIESDCLRVVAASKQFAELSKSSAEGLSAVQDAADKIAKDARATLDADYNGIFTK